VRAGRSGVGPAAAWGLVLLAVCCSAVAGQTLPSAGSEQVGPTGTPPEGPPGSAPATITPPGHQPREGLRDPLRQALELIRAGRALEAVPILEELYRTRPQDPGVLQALTQAYLFSGNPDRAVELCRDLAERDGQRDPNLWVDLSRCCQQAGRPGEAVEALLRCLKDRPSWIVRLMDQFELAVSDSLTGGEALRVLQSAASAPEAPAAWKEILAHVFATSGREYEAIAVLMEADRAQALRGELLSNLARTLAKRGVPEAALAAYDSVLALDPADGTAENVWFEKGELLAGLGRVPEAIAAYAEGERRFPAGPLAMQATLARADLLMTKAHDLAGAQAAYAAVLARAGEVPRRERKQPLLDRARIALAECALRLEDFAAARERYGELEANAAQAELREKAAFELAEMRFFEGEFVEAEEAYYQLTDRYPSGNWVNDAFRRVLLLGETNAAPPVREYARIEYLRRVDRTAEALAMCRAALQADPAPPLRPELRFQETQLLAVLGEWASADSALASLLAEDPRSRVAPAALLWWGERAQERPEGRGVAAQAYERIVLEYPASFEARRARSRLRELRETEANS
jgi:tetratricopeptide (TPR) repeat protein